MPCRAITKLSVRNGCRFGCGTTKAAAVTAALSEPDTLTAPEPQFEPEDEIDLSALTDAPPESVKGPLDQLAEAFPGSELITDD